MKERNTAITVGVLILVAYAVLANSLTDSKIIVLLAESVSGVAVIGIAVLMYPFFKPHNSKLTSSYFVLKIVEGTLMVFAGALFLSLNTNLFGLRDSIYVVHTYVFIVSAFMFYYLMYLSKLVPRFISVWGGVALLLLLIVNFLETSIELTTTFLAIGYSPIILNEVVLAFYLIIRGFDKKVTTK